MTFYLSTRGIVSTTLLLLYYYYKEGGTVSPSRGYRFTVQGVPFHRPGGYRFTVDN